ncbi:MAG TPA: zf-HC2 domain-containing protein [Blastocatellia bacterium]|nr:zf-HC2 domain-containing protein [Blastocatellia bacterium]
MARKSAHPSRQLFDYLNGALSDDARQQVERHLNECADCAALANLVRELKDAAVKSRAPSAESPQSSNAAELSTQDEHPDVAALAAFFYAGSPRRRDAQVAAHVARCGECAASVAMYARAERAAADYEPAAEENAVPAAAWEMIREWEESAYAQAKPAGEAVNHELLTKLTAALRERRDQAEAAGADAVPVRVIDREGHVRGVEMFKQITDAEGASVLRHAEASEQFDAKPAHVLLDFGGENRVILSERVERDTLRIKRPVRRTQPLRADYFIIED